MSARPELKVDDEHGFIRFYKSLPAVTDDTVRLFDRGDWYTAHGPDATYIAKTVYKSLSVIRQLGRSDDSGLPSVTLTVTAYRQFLREALFQLGKRVEIWGSPSGRMNWKLVKQASPGNLQDVEDDIGGQFDAAPMIMAIKISTKMTEARTVGVCFADATARELGVSEFLDNDLFSNLESLLIQLGAKECLVQVDRAMQASHREDDENTAPPVKDPDLAKLRQVIDNCGVVISERPLSDFATRDIEQDLSQLLKNERAVSTLPQSELKLAMGAASALIKYLDILGDSANFGQYNLYQHDLANYMKLDAAALKALHLMPGPRDGSKTMSIYGLLNHCKTAAGSRLLAQWLKQPLMNRDEIVKRQVLVEAFYNDTELRQNMQEVHLRSIPDVYRLTKRFQRGKANLEDVVRAYQVVIRIPGFLQSLESIMDEEYRDALDALYTSPLRELSGSLGKLQDLVETTVDLDAMDQHEFIIKAEFDDSLRLIRQKLEKIRRDMDTEYHEAARDLGQERDKKIFLENHKVHGWCMRLTRTEASCIRNKSQYQECSTQKNGVYFTTRNLQALRRQHDQYNAQYNKHQSGLVQEVVSVASSYCPVLERLAGVLAHLDVIVAFAHTAVNAPTAYVRPKVHPRGEGQTILREARHPCLEVQDDIQFITNDVELVRDKSSFLIITGPNMGGKSTYIRQIGVIALLAQVGSFVPCSEAELTLFDSILARVGASDSQLKGVSTFMAEMLETANILKSATAESLIIIDELGRGTSTYDGFGLAWAISEHIIQEIGCFAMFATHFHELTALANQFPQVHNLHVTAHIAGLEKLRHGQDARESDSEKKRQVTLLYKVEPGVCDQSFGIHVAELVRFPEKVIRMARRKADELEDFSTSSSEPTHEGGGESTKAPYQAHDVSIATERLRHVLQQWKADVQQAAPDDESARGRFMADKMRALILGDEVLLANPFFQSIKTL